MIGDRLEVYISSVLFQDGFGCLHYKQTLESTEIVISLLQYGADVDIQKEVRQALLYTH